MYTKNTAILLRKVRGVLTACWHSSTNASVMPRASSLHSIAGAFAAFLFLPLMVLAILAALFSGPHLWQVAHHPTSLVGIAVVGETLNVEMKNLLDGIKGAFEQFKASNDERLKQIEARGYASADVESNVRKANDAISDLSKQIQEMQANLRSLENLQARAALSADASAAIEMERKHARVFKALTTRTPVRLVKDVTDADVKAMREYDAALDQYLRFGDKGLNRDVQAALSVGSDPAGGYIVTPDRSGRIVQLIFESSPIRQLASVQTISTDAYEGDLDLDEASSGWVGETEARSETNTPEIGEWRIPVFEQYANPGTTQKMLDDADRDVGGWLETKIADKLTRVENNAFVVGNGVKKPRGYTTYPAGTPTKSGFGKIVQVGTGTSAAYPASAPGDKIIDLVFGLKATYRTGAAFVMSRLTVAETRKLKDGQGNYLWQPIFTERQGGNLVGFPIVEAEDMPLIAANSLSVAFGNFKEAYQIVDHSTGIRVLRDPFTNKPKIMFYTTKRVGGDVVNFDAIRLLKFG